MKMFFRGILILIFMAAGTAYGAQPKKNYTATRIEGTKPVIDARFDESIWAITMWQGSFVMHQPFDGRQPTQNTEFAIAYDDDNIYIAIKAFDSSPDSIQTRLTHKDDIDGDLAGVQLDSYNDKLTAFCFYVSASGVKTDILMSNDGSNEDETWDPVWFVKTMVTAEGWQAEMRIPLSQLRFDKRPQQVWGLEVARYIFRNEELSLWQPIPRDSPGWVSLMGEMDGINDIKPRRQVEFAPYVLGRAEKYEKDASDPFLPGKELGKKFGLDGKVGLTNNLIMDFTVNPDFGQVEADPSEVNLTAYESYFREKRPFFIEGKNIYSFALMGGDGDLSEENIFYSRRIGRNPQYYPDLADREYIKMPGYTNILGAAKISGKTKKGLSIGIMESITANEKAQIDSAGKRREISVEPLTNYFVGRIQQDFNKGTSVLGAMFTATNRSITEPDLNFLLKSAYTGGVDFTHSWKEKKYYFTIRSFFSEVQGSKESLLRTQESSARYFQRPDADYLTYDTVRTSLAGNGGRLEIGKQGGGHWRYAGFLTWKSPGLELNDIGFLRDADDIMQIFWVGYRIWEPFSIFRSLNLNLNQWTEYDFGLTNVDRGGNFNGHMQFKNYWFLSTGINLNSQILSKTMLRGGPYFKVPGGISYWMGLGTDERKKFNAELEIQQSRHAQKYSREDDYTIDLTYKPVDVFQLSIQPSLMVESKEMQYVSTPDILDPSITEPRYIFAHLDQKVLSMSVRLSLSLLPNLNLQYWGQPFIATGSYTNFKRVTNPMADDFGNRYQTLNNTEAVFNSMYNIYEVNETNDMVTDYSFDNPDFNIKEFRSNLVLRWEYVPGSDLYLVWSQSRFNDTAGQFDFGRGMSDLFSETPHNVWLIKLSYRFRL
jgi:hypothetical protein